jgi:hypothetical protein
VRCHVCLLYAPTDDLKTKPAYLKVLSNGTKGGVGVVSIYRPLISLHFRRFKKKNFWSGKTTSQGASLNQGASGVENRIAERPFYGFSIMPEWGVFGLEPNWQ